MINYCFPASPPNTVATFLIHTYTWAARGRGVGVRDKYTRGLAATAFGRSVHCGCHSPRPAPTPYLPCSGLTIICPLLYSARLCLPSLACRLSLVAQVLPGSTLTKHISALFTVPPMFVVGTILHQTSHTFFLRLTSEVIQLFHY